MITLKKIIAEGVIVCLLGSLLAVQTAQAAAIPVILKVSAVPSTFNPKNGESTNITFNLNTTAYYSVAVLDSPNETLVKNIVSTEYAPGSGDYTETWNGKTSSGTYVSAGPYTIKITAKNSSGEDIDWTKVTVDYPATTPTLTKPTISGLTASPKTFDPKKGETSTIKFDLDKAALYYADILKSGVVIDNIAQGVSVLKAGEYAEKWNGQNLSNTYAEEGSYLVRVKAQNDAGWADPAYAVLYVDYPTEQKPLTGDAPVITNDYAYPNPFTPSSQSTKIYYTLNTSAKITVSTLSGTDTKVLKDSKLEGPGTYFAAWDGKNAAGTAVPNGSHVYKIVATNDDGYDVELGTVDTAGGGVVIPAAGVPYLYNVYVDPYIFDPVDEDVKICYTVANTANISIAVTDGEVMIRKVLDGTPRDKGTYCETWNGKGTSGSFANPGTYNVKVYAENSKGSDVAFTILQVNLGQYYTPTDAPDILDVSIEPDPFNPVLESEAMIYYQINKKGAINLTIEDLAGNHKKTLIDGIVKNQGTHWVKWYGEDKFGNLLPGGEYRVKVEAWNVYGMDIYRKKFFVGLGGPGTVIIAPGNMCAGFSDVAIGSPYCDAITRMKQYGIFSGYDDGTFRPNQPINRAETVKVILLALNKTVIGPDGTNLGFWDVDPFGWYTSYLRTARVHGIIHGYPDGSFKAGNTINRVELLKIFLEATELNIPYCSGQPYPDVPNDNPWYLKYACFVKHYNLISVDKFGRLNPASPMKRGDVADLFYRAQIQGLFDFFPLSQYTY
ncbi:S-layer homology domain-containing protein [Patescibacteria group bacterium]|nr:S-layer homology domain-containing protein [Patescibacteria group bacterium]